MKHPAFLLVAALAMVLAVSITAYPGRTATPTSVSWTENVEPQTLQSSGVHAMVGASFHAVSAGF